MADIKKIATRDSYGNALKELGAEFDNLVVLDADLAGATKTATFLKAFPERHFDAGIAEANMICMAAGMSTGSLGQGVSVATGMALAAKHTGKSNRVYSLLGDGEIQEGQVWEACMAAAHYKLDNLCIVIDNNGLQIDGNIADVMSPYPIVDKLVAFGFDVQAIDGHDFDAIEAAFAHARTVTGKPSAIVISSTKGKGVSFMENNAGWHGKAPNDAEYAQAMAELKAQLAELEA